MTQEPSHPGSRHFRAVTVPTFATLSDAVNATYDRLDELTALALTHWHQLAPPVGDVPLPVSADGTGCAPLLPSVDWVRRAALVAAEGLTFTASGTANFDAERTEFLADLGRDLRKDGITVEHHTAAAEALSRALCELHGFTYPGADLTYQAAEDAGLPDGLAELLQTVDLGIRITALGAVDDDEAGIPAAADAEVLEIQHRSPRVTVVRLQVTPPETGWPGQFLEVRTPGNPGQWQTAASAIPPNPGGLLEFALFHPVDTPPKATVGEHWVVANPTGALEIPEDDTPVLMLALGAGLAPLRALILHVSARSTVPPVHLYWQVDHADDLHEYTGLLGLAGVFDWLRVTPVITGTDARDDAWFDSPDREQFSIYSRPRPEQLVNGEPLRIGTAVETALADGTHRGRRVLIAGDPADRAAVRAVVAELTAAGVADEVITAEPV
ncbi:hypothetical protein [Corynebacterium terpenotabidum]|uniref:FAD-binding FR-type domain-containing protein n=1 Tax=Corynebacterium terpenotabidum Y-11 TaxID=1200352 RepID=S4XED4_9CORY|nr:hypothetical protein [Corynebacterium terpenotabidum]AGP29945.1 hypothetical protein A606_01450 [Corynebacterium terpenotabidum Y-11]